MIYNRLVTNLQTDESNNVSIEPVADGAGSIVIYFGNEATDGAEYLELTRADWAKLCHAVSFAFSDIDGAHE